MVIKWYWVSENFIPLSSQAQLVCKSFGAELLWLVSPFAEGMVWLYKSEALMKDQLNIKISKYLGCGFLVYIGALKPVNTNSTEESRA